MRIWFADNEAVLNGCISRLCVSPSYDATSDIDFQVFVRRRYLFSTTFQSFCTTRVDKAGQNMIASCWMRTVRREARALAFGWQCDRRFRGQRRGQWREQWTGQEDNDNSKITAIRRKAKSQLPHLSSAFSPLLDLPVRLFSDPAVFLLSYSVSSSIFTSVSMSTNKHTRQRTTMFLQVACWEAQPPSYTQTTRTRILNRLKQYARSAAILSQAR